MSTMKGFPIVRGISVAAALAALAASCSSSNSSSSPPQSIYLTVNVGTDPLPGGNTTSCNIQEPLAPFFHIGTEGAPVANGGLFALPSGTGEATVVLSCVVHADPNGGFDVNVQETQGEADSFSFHTTSPLTDTPNAQSGITVSVGLNPDTYSDSTDCMFTLSAEGNPSITSGRIWGTVVCPTSTYTEASATCDVSATFILQNCGE